MILKIDKESLSDLNTNIKEEVDKYNNEIDNIIKQIKELNIYWQGNTYNAFITRYNNSSKSFLESKLFLENFYNAINGSLKNYTNLSEGVHYNE